MKYCNFDRYKESMYFMILLIESNKINILVKTRSAVNTKKYIYIKLIVKESKWKINTI